LEETVEDSSIEDCEAVTEAAVVDGVNEETWVVFWKALAWHCTASKQKAEAARKLFFEGVNMIPRTILCFEKKKDSDV
jgi:hypothetical protein